MSRFDETIAGSTEVISSTISQVLSEIDGSVLQNPIPFSHFVKGGQDLEKCIDLKCEIPVPHDVQDDEKETLESDITAFNNTVGHRVKETVCTSTFEALASNFLGTIIESYKQKRPQVNLGKGTGIQVNEDAEVSFNSLFVILDLAIYVSSLDKGSKRIFHRLVSNISEILLEISSDLLDVFWYYMESRLLLLGQYVFDKSVTGDRIALLEICNPLTDKYYRKTSTGQNNTYKKDTFNNSLQARIRMFVNNLLSLEDNTGLNKYFSVAERTVPEAEAIKRPTNFTRDVIKCLQLFRDPYTYMKTQKLRELREASHSCGRIFDELLAQEIKYLRSTRHDPFAYKPKATAPEADQLLQKYSEIEFFPEVYWQGVFNEPQEDNIRDIMDDHKMRESFLLQLLLMVNFFSEMTSTFRRKFLSGFPAKTKHITDDAVNELVANNFNRIKKEAVSEFRKVDSPFSFLLLNLFTLERQWWRWLVYNKDPETQKPLLGDRILTKDEIEATKDQFKAVYPLKEKRYFNVYATPQLSRRMKGKRGLENLEVEKGEEEMDVEDEDGIKTWKRFRRKRQHQWVYFGDILKGDEEGEDEKEEKEVDEQHREEEDQLIKEEGKDIGMEVEPAEEEIKEEVKEEVKEEDKEEEKEEEKEEIKEEIKEEETKGEEEDVKTEETQ